METETFFVMIACFNRYMVECECVWTIGYGHTGKGFNRYMVECEYNRACSC